MNKNLLSLINTSYEIYNDNHNEDYDDYEVEDTGGKRRKLTDNERLLRWYK